MKSNKTKEQVYRDAFYLFVDSIPEDVLQGYLNDTDGEGTLRLQFWCGENMKGWIMDWCTGIGIIEAVEHLVKVAIENGNIKFEKKYLCDGCNVRGNWEHRCHGENCDCDNPVCMERQGKITHEELMQIVNAAEIKSVSSR